MSFEAEVEFMENERLEAEAAAEQSKSDRLGREEDRLSAEAEAVDTCTNKEGSSTRAVVKRAESHKVQEEPIERVRALVTRRQRGDLTKHWSRRTGLTSSRCPSNMA